MSHSKSRSAGHRSAHVAANTHPCAAPDTSIQEDDSFMAQPVKGVEASTLEKAGQQLRALAADIKAIKNATLKTFRLPTETATLINDLHLLCDRLGSDVRTQQNNLDNIGVHASVKASQLPSRCSRIKGHSKTGSLMTSTIAAFVLLFPAPAHGGPVSKAGTTATAQKLGSPNNETLPWPLQGAASDFAEFDDAQIALVVLYVLLLLSGFGYALYVAKYRCRPKRLRLSLLGVLFVLMSTLWPVLDHTTKSDWRYLAQAFLITLAIMFVAESSVGPGRKGLYAWNLLGFPAFIGILTGGTSQMTNTRDVMALMTMSAHHKVLPGLFALYSVVGTVIFHCKANSRRPYPAGNDSGCYGMACLQRPARAEDGGSGLDTGQRGQGGQQCGGDEA